MSPRPRRSFARQSKVDPTDHHIGRLCGVAPRRAGDEKGSLLVTSQVPVARWYELVGDPAIGDAILDRVVDRAHRIELKGPSLRKRHAVSAPAGDESLTNAKER